MATRTVIPGISALKDHIGKRMGPTEWVTVTQAQIDAFAEATGDQQWIHVDPERAKRDSPFGQTIAHGYLTLALAPGLLAELLSVEDTSMAVNYGIDKLRLPAPVPATGRVRMTAEIKHVREVPGGAARTTIGISLEVEGSQRAACVADVIYVYFPRDGPRART